LKPGAVHRFAFYEGNYELEPGRIMVSLAPDVALQVVEKDEADEALKNRAPIDYKPGDEARLRKARATFSLAWTSPPPAEGRESPTPSPVPTVSVPTGSNTWLGFAALLGLTLVFVVVRTVRWLVRGR
jgi:hypothetical protein